MELVPGGATAAGTAEYVAAHPGAKGHYRMWQGISVSSLGLGTYLGETGPSARASYAAAVATALQSGINVIDTAANYRDQASERDVGAGIRAFLAAGGKRESFAISSKAGILHGDCDETDPDGWFQREYIDRGILRKGDVLSGHSLAPAFIAHQLERSRQNLGLATIDVYFLHNPEHQLEWGVSEAEFYARVEAAFTELERAADAGSIGAYGVATWDGLRAGPGVKGHLSLVKLVHHAGAARVKVGGRASEHHFRAMQLPVNLAMTEAALVPTQPYRFGAQTILDCAKDLGMFVMTSASLMQMRITGRIPSAYKEAFGTTSDAQTALQFTRSVPGVTTALVGMARPAHVRENAAFATSQPPQPAIVKTLLGTGSIHGA